MSGKNIHKKPFDEGTITKLEIFQKYAREWLPTFVMSKRAKVQVFDFFAGTGYDVRRVPGSPIRILEEIKGQINHIIENGTIVQIYFNEFKKKKYKSLEESCNDYLKENPDLRPYVTIHLFNKDFEELYEELEPKIGEVPSLVYLDQNGIKFIADKYFMSLLGKKQTDFFYFLSSSFFLRFGNTPEFKKIVPEATLEEIRAKPYKYIHNEILNYLKSKLPVGSEIKLYPFTIRKQAGVYGIIFGATHILAADKFLRLAWKINDVNGSANFDIDDDWDKDQLELWGPQPIKKVDAFKRDLRNKILAGEIKNNREAFTYTIEKGHIGSHAKEEIAAMRKEKIITYDAPSPKVTYEAAIKKDKIVVYKLEI